MKPEAEHITIEVPALISKTKWDEIQKKRTFNKSKAKRVTVALDYFLRDLLGCGECGSKIYLSPIASPGRISLCHDIMVVTITRQPISVLRQAGEPGASSP